MGKREGKILKNMHEGRKVVFFHTKGAQKLNVNELEGAGFA